MTRRYDTKPDPLERQMIECPECKGDKTVHDTVYSVKLNAFFSRGSLIPCTECNGTGKVPESLESQVKRLQEMIQWLLNETCLPAISKTEVLDAAFKAVEKEKENGKV